MLLAFLEANVRKLLRDEDPGAYARNPEEIRECILRKAVEFDCGLSAEELITTVNVGPSDEAVVGGTDVDAILSVWREDGWVLERIPEETIQTWALQGNASGRPAYYSLRMFENQMLIRVSPVSQTPEVLSIRQRRIAGQDYSDLYDVPVSDLMARAIETAVAAEMYTALPPDDRERLRLSADIVKAWLASSSVLLGKERDRASRMTRASHIPAGVP